MRFIASVTKMHIYKPKRSYHIPTKKVSLKMNSNKKENENDSAHSVHLYTARWKCIQKPVLQSCGLITRAHLCSNSFHTEELY